MPGFSYGLGALASESFPFKHLSHDLLTLVTAKPKRMHHDR